MHFNQLRSPVKGPWTTNNKVCGASSNWVLFWEEEPQNINYYSIIIIIRFHFIARRFWVWIPWGGRVFLCSLHVLPMPMWVFSSHSIFLSYSRDMHFGMGEFHHGAHLCLWGLRLSGRGRLKWFLHAGQVAGILSSVFVMKFFLSSSRAYSDQYKALFMLFFSKYIETIHSSVFSHSLSGY